MNMKYIRASTIALIMEAASTPKTSVNFYQTIRRNNPEDSHLHTRRRENLKYQIIQCLSYFNFHSVRPIF
jgi:hypothetical protein